MASRNGDTRFGVFSECHQVFGHNGFREIDGLLRLNFRSFAVGDIEWPVGLTLEGSHDRWAIWILLERDVSLVGVIDSVQNKLRLYA